MSKSRNRGLFLGVFQSQLIDIAAALGGTMTTRVVDQNLAHELRGHSEEMSTILPLRQSLFGHAHVGFMNQGRALQSVVGTFAL